MKGLRTRTESTESEGSRRRALMIGAPVAVVALAIGGVVFAMQSDGDSIKTAEASDLTTTTVATTTTEASAEVFSEAEVTTQPAPTTTPTTSTTSTTSTTTTTSTTVPPSTLPEQPDVPIAPPADPRGYEDQIQLGGISIPKLGVDEPLLEGIRLTTLDNGPGHWPGTAMPGEVGNVVVAAHRTSHGGPFRHIDTLVAGDVVNFTVDGEVIEYTVTGTQIVNPDAIWIVDPTDTPTATLFACHPPGSVAQRIVVNLALSE
ncbi:class E sortase [Ilumatobacter coccineus]|uniref:Peptidase C60 family protein n=1 Tax=Ilumatobacter coccineus (strain NBRC 103263 / KCTC 29153 / YM16-304) TaxID=1313172 RepID=A0A6C7E2D6_ILUCY|nr:class E sortase [Ilumatobacter coccineus]BAN01247.1 peptidase C60 family protein [Ilumatobacter coccineus YM16-304]